MTSQSRKPSRTKAKDQHTVTRFYVKTASTVIEFLMTQMQGKSRTSIKQLLANGQIRLNEHVITKLDHPVSPGDVVGMEKNRLVASKMPASMKIVFEDDHLIVINKDAGLLSMGTAKESLHTAYAYLSDYVKQQDDENKIFIIHRLDRDTSGLMMFAKNQKIQELLQKNWSEVVLCRRYYALVEGFVEYEKGTIRTWLNENPKSLIVYVSHPGEGAEAVTHYRVIDGGRHYTLLDVELETGRKNQIRVHMQYIHHPVTGDAKYGAKNNSMGRLGLHAAELTFVHPETGKEMSFKTAVPSAFLRMVKQ